MEEDRMFDVTLMEKFYTLPSQSEDVAIKNAYLLFIGVLCPLVSFHWKEHVKLYVKNKLEAEYKKFLTISDEAYAVWLINVHLPKFINKKKVSRKMKQLMIFWNYQEKVSMKQKHS